ncbi:MAG: glutathione S-transferase [Alphaproteobacteria bacterium 65-7]|nr:MAG: glutathione S-transferase [Alphaproteobacteria bacterium 65-7]
MSDTVLTISSKNYSSWSLRGWLLCRMAGLEFREELLSPDDADARAELLLLSPSFLVPRLTHDGLRVWDTLAIAEYLHERFPQAGLLPGDAAARTHCRAIAGEMHSGFANLRSALPMNLKAHYKNFKIWAAAQADIDRITAIWRECLLRYGGPYLFGETPTLADAMYAPVTTRFTTYDVKLDRICADYCETIQNLPDMIEWIEAARIEKTGIEELEAEF